MCLELKYPATLKGLGKLLKNGHCNLSYPSKKNRSLASDAVVLLLFGLELGIYKGDDPSTRAELYNLLRFIMGDHERFDSCVRAHTLKVAKRRVQLCAEQKLELEQLGLWSYEGYDDKMEKKSMTERAIDLEEEYYSKLR